MPVSSLNHVLTASAQPQAAAAAKTKKTHGATFAGALAQASVKASESKASINPEILDSKKVPKGEKTKPVEGHAYADITAGPRNGMYLNTSGNERHGMAFVLVKRDGKEFHVYGTGKDRLVVCLKRKDDNVDVDAKPDKADKKTTTPVNNSAASGTTGARL